MNRKHRHYSEIEKQELLDRIESSGGPIRETLVRLGISKSTYYDWKNAGEDVCFSPSIARNRL